jgi:hypothetical protein
MNEYTCDNCLIKFKRYPSTIKGKTVFCSNKCKGQYQSQKCKGEDNPNYKDGNWQKESFCECGELKDCRSERCSTCAKRGIYLGGVRRDGQSDEDLTRLVLSSDTISEVAKLMGTSRYWVAKGIARLNLDTSHMRRCNNRPYSSEDIFIIRKEGKRNPVLRKHFLNKTINKYFCEECGLESEWNGKKLTLQLHHKNGDSLDDRIRNLCWLCPNCHSQTGTFVGANSRKDTNGSQSERG